MAESQMARGDVKNQLKNAIEAPDKAVKNRNKDSYKISDELRMTQEALKYLNLIMFLNQILMIQIPMQIHSSTREIQSLE